MLRAEQGASCYGCDRSDSRSTVQMSQSHRNLAVDTGCGDGGCISRSPFRVRPSLDCVNSCSPRVQPPTGRGFRGEVSGAERVDQSVRARRVHVDAVVASAAKQAPTPASIRGPHLAYGAGPVNAPPTSYT